MNDKDKPLLIDFFCGAGGCSVGYSNAGFDVVGCDIEPQKRYLFDFLQMDALEALRRLLAGESLLFGDRRISLVDVSAIHASPPCQDYCSLSHLSNGSERLIGVTRRLLQETKKPYVIENVEGAKGEMVNPIMLCGTMFPGLKVRRHRLFESWPEIWFPPAACNHDYGRIPRAGRGANEHGFMSISGHLSDVATAKVAMGIGWMTGNELSQAIPPAYTEFIGKVLLTASVELSCRADLRDRF